MKKDEEKDLVLEAVLDAKTEKSLEDWANFKDSRIFESGDNYTPDAYIIERLESEK